ALSKRRAKARSILLRHRPQPQIVRALFRQRQADQPAAILRHKVNRLRSNKLRSQRQVAFILAVLIIDDHDHPPRLDLRHGLGHVRKHISAFHLHLSPSSLSTHPILRSSQKRTPPSQAASQLQFEIYSVASISKPQASSSASGIYFEFLFRRAHSRSLV